MYSTVTNFWDSTPCSLVSAFGGSTLEHARTSDCRKDTVGKNCNKLQLLNIQRVTTRNTITAQHEIYRSMIVTPIYSEQPDTIG